MASKQARRGWAQGERRKGGPVQELKELTLEVTEGSIGGTVAYKIVTDGSVENTAAYSLRPDEWMRSATASLSEDGSMLVVAAVLESEDIPVSSWRTEVSADSVSLD